MVLYDAKNFLWNSRNAVLVRKLDFNVKRAILGSFESELRQGEGSIRQKFDGGP
jgi:hypothetical protein